MKSADCSKIIQGALSRIEGIVTAVPDLEKRTMVITYNSTKLSIKNVEFLIAGVGFDANDEQGKPEAKAALPAGCRCRIRRRHDSQDAFRRRGTAQAPGGATECPRQASRCCRV
jgi:cation transport ATPase